MEQIKYVGRNIALCFLLKPEELTNLSSKNKTLLLSIYCIVVYKCFIENEFLAVLLVSLLLERRYPGF